MDALPYATPPRWWGPRLSALFLFFFRPVRVCWQRYQEKLGRVEIRNLDRLRRLLDEGCGIIITPNHPHHSDPFVLLRLSDAAKRHFCFMVAWQSFLLLNWFSRRVLQRHGCFSVDREGQDVQALRTSIDIVRQGQNPLVIFIEGEVYHNGERLYPFNSGPGAIALAAARRTERRVVLLPAAIRHRYLVDPTPQLTPLVAAMEQKLAITAPPNAPLAERVRGVAEALLALREKQQLGQANPGPFRERTLSLLEHLLSRLEAKYGAAPRKEEVPGRVTHLRRQAILAKEAAAPGSPDQQTAQRDLDDLLLAMQLYSYADDYLPWPPSIEHLAEIVDKFEEDLLGVVTAHARGPRRATIVLGEPLDVRASRGDRQAAQELTAQLAEQVRGLLEELREAQSTGALAGDSARRS